MFFIGSNVVDWPVQAIRAKDDGHEICVHTWSHEYMTSFSNQQAFAELYYTRKAIKELLGVTPKCWRPPFGDVDNRIRFIAAALNMTTIVWSEDTDDWKVSFSLFPVCGERVVGCTRLGDSSFDCDGPGTRLRFPGLREFVLADHPLDFCSACSGHKHGLRFLPRLAQQAGR